MDCLIRHHESDRDLALLVWQSSSPQVLLGVILSHISHAFYWIPLIHDPSGTPLPNWEL